MVPRTERVMGEHQQYTFRRQGAAFACARWNSGTARHTRQRDRTLQFVHKRGTGCVPHTFVHAMAVLRRSDDSTQGRTSHGTRNRLGCHIIAAGGDSMHEMLSRLSPTDFPAIARGRTQTLQVNVGYRCNQTCVHCHVNAGPTRTESMDRGTADVVIAFLEASAIGTLDITGGAPELNPNFRYLVESARSLDMH